MKHLALLILLALTGCATNTGIVMHPGDAERCKAEGCTVWTDAELDNMANHIIRQTAQQVGASCRKGGI